MLQGRDFAKVLPGARNQRIHAPGNGKVARYNRILAGDFPYAPGMDLQRQRALQIWNIHYSYHRPHTAADNRPPVSRLRSGVTNVTASYT